MRINGFWGEVRDALVDMREVAPFMAEFAVFAVIFIGLASAVVAVLVAGERILS